MSNLKLTDEQLITLENMGADFFSIEDCAIALQLPLASLKSAISNREHPAHKHYYKGRLPEVAKHRRNVKSLANMGSSPAQQMVQRFIDESSDSGR